MSFGPSEGSPALGSNAAKGAWFRLGAGSAIAVTLASRAARTPPWTAGVFALGPRGISLFAAKARASNSSDIPQVCRKVATKGVNGASLPSFVVGNFVDPVESPVHQQELGGIQLAQLHSDRLVLQGAIQDQVGLVRLAVGQQRLLARLRGSERPLRRIMVHSQALHGLIQ